MVNTFSWAHKKCSIEHTKAPWRKENGREYGAWGRCKHRQCAPGAMLQCGVGASTACEKGRDGDGQARPAEGAARWRREALHNLSDGGPNVLLGC